MYETGRAGAYVSGQMWRHRGRGVLCAVAAAVLGAAAVGGLVLVLVVDAPVLRVICALAGTAAAVGCWAAWVRSARALRRAARFAVGARSEREARVAVRSAGAAAVGYGLVLGGGRGDCDIVVFTRTGGAAAIEVKTGHGEVHVSGGTMRVGRRTLEKSPTSQAAHQARLLARALGRKRTLGIVYVPGMTNAPFAISGVWVCGGHALHAVLSKAPRIFDTTDEAIATMERLRANAST
jgi:hypothetical protein